MKPFLHLDFETRSTQSLAKEDSVGLSNYWAHSDTKVLMLAYAFGDEPVELWEPRFGKMSDRLHTGLVETGHPLAAWNSVFERKGLETKLGIITDIERWHDPQASARYLSMPGALDKVGPILGLPAELQKDKRGEELIKLFSVPHLTRKKKGETQQTYFNDYKSHPLEWEEFKEYCKQDVRAEREIMHREIQLGVFPLPELERKIWVLDQTVNDRGVPCDLGFVRCMHELGVRSKRESIEKQNKLTGLENSNSPKQMLVWAKNQGYEPNTLRKDTVESWLKYHAEKLTPLCIEAFKAKQAVSSTTYTKLAAIIRQISPDGTIKNQFLYMGSSRCGRWSGSAVQLQNLARPGVLKNELTGMEYNFEDDDVVDEARQMVREMDYDGIQIKFGSVLLTIKNLIRTVFSVEQCKD